MRRGCTGGGRRARSRAPGSRHQDLRTPEPPPGNTGLGCNRADPSMRSANTACPGGGTSIGAQRRDPRGVRADCRPGDPRSDRAATVQLGAGAPPCRARAARAFRGAAFSWQCRGCRSARRLRSEPLSHESRDCRFIPPTPGRPGWWLIYARLRRAACPPAHASRALTSRWRSRNCAA